MKEPQVFVIVGAGLAGAKAAQTLRENGFGGEIVLLGEEPERPYERPSLSKGLLLGTAERESVFVHEPGWYTAHDVDLRTATRVTAVDDLSRTPGPGTAGTPCPVAAGTLHVSHASRCAQRAWEGQSPLVHVDRHERRREPTQACQAGCS